MKKILFYTICCAALSLMACSNDMEVTKPTEVGKITLSLDASGATFGTRGDVADNEAERKLEWIDIFVFAAGGDNSIATDDALVYHERIDHSSAMEPHTLGLDINSLIEDQAYYVDVIANSKTLNEINNISADITTRGALFSKIETTEYIQLTGLDINNVPTSFLMDGVAYLAGGSDDKSAVVLRADDDVSQNVNLNVTLRRAAAKVVFNFKLKEGIDAMFDSFGISDGAATPTYTPAGSYFVDNMKYKAMLTAEAENEYNWTDGHLRTTSEIPYGDYLKAGDAAGGKYQTMSLTTYVYCHKWDYHAGSSSSLSEIEPSVIVNLPVVTTTGENNPRNYYEISLDVTPTIDGYDEHFALKRNHYYVINATINALGGSNPQIRVELENIDYAVYDWDEKTIDVGGESDASYLTLNTDHIEMHNKSEDATTLSFASSSAIENITLVEAYYYNKYGNRINLASGDDTDQAVYGLINAKEAVDGALTGNIAVTSPLQYNSADAHKNTIRYLTFEVQNEQGLTKRFTVMQYPLTYITNQRGYYSYRSDFIAAGQSTPTTYEDGGEGNDIVAISYNQGTYNYSNETGGFFNSKVAHSTNQQSASYYYYHDSWRGEYWQRSTGGYSNNNIRMYHVRVTATSNDYTIGIPRITDGITDAGADNAKLVSPSFMIASRLGVITSNTNSSSGLSGVTWQNSNGTDAQNAEKQAFYANHCANYVETYQRVENGVTKTVHLDDWRLPTAAELNIIIGLQGTNADNTNYKAIDYLLNAGYYYSASGPQINNNREDSFVNMTSVRCVRDAYDDKTPPVTTN